MIKDDQPLEAYLWSSYREYLCSPEKRPKWLRVDVGEGLQEVGWDAGRLCQERKGHAVKVELARRLRGETTMTLQWIAENLHMGIWTNVSNRLRFSRPAASPKPGVKDKD